jgi:hypothetical protein
MGCSRPIGFQPCNSLWFRANFGLQLSMELHSSSKLSLSLSLSLYGVQFPEKVSTEYIFLLLSPTEYVSLQLSLSTEYIFLENSTEYIFLEHTLSLSLYGVHFPPTLSYGVRFPPTLSTDYIRSIFPSNSLSTDYIFLQLSTE